MLLRNCPPWGDVAAIATLRLTDVTQPIRTNATGQPATVGVVVRVAVVVIVAEGYPKAPTTREMAVPESTAEVAATHAAAEVTSTHAAAAEVTSTHAAATEVAATHAAAAEVTATHATTAEVTATTAPSVAASTTAASTTCERIGGDASASNRQRGNDDRDFVQRKFPHGASFPIETTSVIARTPVAVRRSIEVAQV
jgi:hypothetical protein